MDADVARAERIEATAVADLFAAAPPRIAELLGAASTTIADAVCVSTLAAAPSRELNHVHALGADGSPVDDATLDAIAAWYAERQGTYVVAIVPAQDPRLRDALVARGFTPTRAWSKFVHDPAAAEPPPPTELRVEPARPEEFGGVVTAAFEMPEAMAGWLAALTDRPGWTCLEARDETDAALAAGAVFQADGAAWLSFGATLPDARGRGAQRTLLAERVRLAREAGCDLVVTETGVAVAGAPQQSERNILRAGFRVAYERPHLAAPGFPD